MNSFLFYFRVKMQDVKDVKDVKDGKDTKVNVERKETEKQITHLYRVGVCIIL
jgi:hypothetical protein